MKNIYHGHEDAQHGWREDADMIVLNNKEDRISEELITYFTRRDAMGKFQTCRLVNARYPHPDVPGHAQIQCVEIDVLPVEHQSHHLDAACLLMESNAAIVEAFCKGKF